VLPKYWTVICLHGCFWLGHANCSDFRFPKTRTEWWEEKINSIRQRDLRNEKALTSMGWNVVTIWECTTKTIESRKWLVGKIPSYFQLAFFKDILSMKLR